MWYDLSLPDVEKKLQTNISEGLTTTQVESQLLIHGKNKVAEGKTDTLFVLFLRQFKSPLIFILVAAGVVVFFLGEFIDAGVIFFVLLFNSIVGVIQEGKAQNTLSALKRFVQTDATVLRDGKEVIIPDTDIVPGDILILQEGEKIAADARILESANLAIAEASLTGESHPVHKIVDAIPTENLPVSDQQNMVFKGTYVMAGNGRGVVVATGNDTVIGKISQSIALIDAEIPLKASVRYLSRLIVVVAGIIVGGFFFIGVSIGKSGIEMFTTSVSLAVSIIPEGLPIVMTIVLASGVFRMAKRNAVVKNLQAVEALGHARIIAVDKTGTITKNEMVLKEVFIDGKHFEVSGVGYDPNGNIKLGDDTVDPLAHPELIHAGKVASFCANAHTMFIDETKTFAVSGDPTEAALLVFAQKVGFNKSALEHEAPKISEIPFDYKTKYHATSHLKDGGQYITVVGAPEVVMSFSNAIYTDGHAEPLTLAAKNELEKTFFAMLKNGMRVIAFGTAELPRDSKFETHDHIPKLTFGGMYGILDGLREEVPEAIAQAQVAGMLVVLITGDHKITATAIAKEAGIFKEGDIVLTGEDVEAMDDTVLSQRLDNVSVFARVTPDHKLRIIQAYKQRGDVIAMTGDGINDAPSLVAADLGVAMGKIGTDVAKEAADIVLLDDNFSTIVAAIEEGRAIYNTIKKVILYLFSTSLGEVLTITGALIIGFPLPLLGAQILWLNLVTDGFLDISLAMDPKEKGLLNKAFERPKKYLVDSLMVRRMFVMAIPMMIGSLYVFNEYYVNDLPKAMTMTLLVLAAFQWLNVWNCRSENTSIFRTNPFSNMYLVGATALVICLQVMAIYAPFMQTILRTVSLSWYDWAFALAVASSIIVAEEIRKLISTQKRHV
ncbi:MAG: HAD-IC family P-type ATPase [Candidatus Azambacteria bacterium]|nr:HAD-IC family P-type ATPase [Candidatus Azambacteria bacterium]